MSSHFPLGALRDSITLIPNFPCCLLLATRYHYSLLLRSTVHTARSKTLPFLLLAGAAVSFLTTRSVAAPPSSSVRDWLQARTTAAFRAWTAEFEQTLQSGDWAARDRRQRAFLLETIGGLPATRNDLKPQVQSVRTMPGYRIEAVRFESQPDFIVTASLYLPAAASSSRSRRVPGVLIPCGHAQVAKAFSEYQAAAALLALHGIAALVYDPLDQGERIQRFDSAGEAISDGVNAHMQEGMAAMLLGRNLARVMVWDGIRALDYLATRPEIDPDRLGVTGHSGGGTLTALLYALDPRLKVAAPCCFISQAHYELWHASTEGAIDGEQLLFGQLAHGFEHADFFLTRPPAPVLLLAATHDNFSIEHTWETFRFLKRAFTIQDASARVDLVEDNVPHSYSQKHREAMVAWMLRWLAGEERTIHEPAIDVLPETDLFATPEGQVLRLPGARSIWDLFRDEARRLAAARGHPTGDELRRRIRLATGIDDRPPPEFAPVDRPVSIDPPAGHRAHALDLMVDAASRRVSSARPTSSVPALRHEDAPPRRVSLLLLEPRAPSNSPPILFVTPFPFPAAIASPPAQSLFQQNRAIAFCHPFGTIQSPAAPAAGTSTTTIDNNTNSEPLTGVGNLENTAWSALYELGESPVRHRAEDILLAARYIIESGLAPAGRVDLAAEEVTAVPALHAAALAPDLFGHVTLRRAPQSWDEYYTLERSYDMNDNFVPGALRYYDLPDLVAELSDRITLEDPVNLLNLETSPVPTSDAAPLDAPTRPGLIGTLYGSGDLHNPRATDTMRQTSSAWQGRGSSWSAEWRGFLLGPIDGEVIFEGRCNRRMELILDGRTILAPAKFPGTVRARATMQAGHPTPIIIRFLQSEGDEGALDLRWSWPGHELSPITETHLRHSRTQLHTARASVRR